jgi:2-polyprenyl-3-methyl-5-hydroxy-6-metoxy-1,4-benzoquinol methylase
VTVPLTLAFLAAGPPGTRGGSGYGETFARLRWRHAVGAAGAVRVVELSPSDPAPSADLDAAGRWLAVFDLEAIPVALAGARAESLPSGALAARRLSLPPRAPSPQTLRELETAAYGLEEAGGLLPAVAFSARELAPRDGETAGQWLARVVSAATPADPSMFSALALADPSDAPREELASRIPESCLRIVDVGCGRGATGASLKSRSPAPTVTGIEKDPLAASAAAKRLDRVLTRDAAVGLSELAAAGERFDAFLLGDVLEHTADPVAVLAAARRAADASATLVASVPNAGHLSLLRDLALGRFDPVPAGLEDAGHLRWFTRASLAEALAESGWSVESIEGLPGAEPPDADVFRPVLAGIAGPGAPPDWDVYQWIAVAHASPRPER